MYAARSRIGGVSATASPTQVLAKAVNGNPRNRPDDSEHGRARQELAPINLLRNNLGHRSH